MTRQERVIREVIERLTVGDEIAHARLIEMLRGLLPRRRQVSQAKKQKQAKRESRAERVAALREALRALDALPEYGSPDVNIGVSNAYSAILALITEKPHDRA